VKIFSEKLSDFPAISFCNLNPFIFLKSHEIFNKYQEDLFFVNNTILSIERLFQIRSKMFLFNDSLKQSFGSYPLNEFMLKCTFNSQICSFKNFTWYYNIYNGNCYTFNSIIGKTQKPLAVNRNNMQNGLSIELFLGLPDQVLPSFSTTGLKIYIHNNSLITRSNEGFELSPGIQTNIAITKTFNLKLESPYNDCKKNGVNSDLYNLTIRENRIYTQK
jgi:hypothetical protein